MSEQWQPSVDLDSSGPDYTAEFRSVEDRENFIKALKGAFDPKTIAEQSEKNEQALDVAYSMGVKMARKLAGLDHWALMETHQAMISNIVSAMEEIDPAQLRDKNCEQKTVEDIAFKIVLLQKFYQGVNTRVENGKDIPDSEAYHDQMISAIAEFATMQALLDAFANDGGKIYHPSKEDDLKRGVDCWLELPNGQVFAIQVKCLHTESKVDNISIIGLTSNNPEEIRKEITENLRFNQYPAFSTAEKKEKFVDRGERMLTFLDNYDNVTPVYVILPKNGNVPRDFNGLTGLPSKNMVDRFRLELGFMSRTERKGESHAVAV